MKIIFDINPLVEEVGSQKKLADLTGIHRNVIGYLCKGEVKAVALKTLAKIMEATGKNLTDLFIIEAE